MKTIEQLADILGMEEELFRERTTDGEPFYTVYEDEKIMGVHNAVYSDGDGGIIFFEGYCHTFSLHGVALHFIDCTSCDITYNTMQSIMKELKEANLLLY